MKRKIGGFLASTIRCAFNANAATECGLTDPHITGYGDVYSVGINDAGQIVGWRSRKPSAGGGRQGFIWSNGKLTILPDSGGHTLLTAAINRERSKSPGWRVAQTAASTDFFGMDRARSASRLSAVEIREGLA